MTLPDAMTAKVAGTGDLSLDRPWPLALVFVGALALILGLRPWDFVHHDTTEIVMWGQSGWSAGFWKHPPLLPWLTRVWSLALPLTPFSLAILTAVNTSVAAWAVWSIARMAEAGPPATRDTGWLAVVLLATIPYASFMAIKLNHNAILVSLWPLTTLAFLRVIDRPTVVRGLLFGVVAAAAVLAKYYSVLLLAGCFSASLASMPRARKFYSSPGPYVTLMVFAAVMAPHILWVMNQQASPIGYAMGSPVMPANSEIRGPLAALAFAVLAPLALSVMALAAYAFWRFAGPRAASDRGRPHRFEREIMIVTVTPYALTIAAVAALNLQGPVAWAMPVFLCLPALVAARISSLRKGVLANVSYGLIAAVLLIAAAGQIGVRAAIARGVDGVADPRRAIVEAATEAWRANTGQRLELVGGDTRLTSAAAVFSTDRPQGWPDFNLARSPWLEPGTIERTGFVGLCRTRDRGCLAAVEVAVGGRTTTRCPLRRQVSYLGAVGPMLEVTLFLVPPAAMAGSTTLSCPAHGG